MRNLALLDLTITPVPSSRGTITDVVFNLDDGSRFAISESMNGDADVAWQVWKFESHANVRKNSWLLPSGLEVDLRILQSQPHICITFKGLAFHSNSSYSASQLATSRYLPDQGVLTLITRGGDIAVWNPSEEDAQVRVFSLVLLG
jgi:hypothetical protein